MKIRRVRTGMGRYNISIDGKPEQNASCLIFGERITKVFSELRARQSGAEFQEIYQIHWI